MIEDGSLYLTVLPEMDGSHGYWQHIAMITTPSDDKGLVTFLTQGTWDVIELLAYDQTDKYV